ncbi:hypothetical protein V8F20_008318 [Naviculisporaceae sp. PSN 640]
MSNEIKTTDWPKTPIRNLYANVADSYYKQGVSSYRATHSSRSSESAGASPSDRISRDRTNKFWESPKSIRIEHSAGGVSAAFMQPVQEGGDGYKANFRPGRPDMSKINNSGQWDKVRGKRLFLTRRKLGGHPFDEEADKSTSRQSSPSPTQSGDDLAPNISNEQREYHDNEGWESDITHQEEGPGAWRSAPKDEAQDSGEGAREDSSAGGSKKWKRGRIADSVDTGSMSKAGKNIQGGENIWTSGWDWPTDNDDRGQVGRNQFSKTTGTRNAEAENLAEPEGLKRRADEVSVRQPTSNAIPDQVPVCRQASWGYTVIDDRNHTVAPKENIRAETDDAWNPFEEISPTCPRKTMSNPNSSPKDDHWGKLDNLVSPQSQTSRQPRLLGNNTTESSVHDENTKAELARIRRQLDILKSTTRRHKKKMKKLNSQFKEHSNIPETNSEGVHDPQAWEQADNLTYIVPLWAIVAGAFACFCLGMMFATGLRGASTCVFNAAV